MNATKIERNRKGIHHKLVCSSLCLSFITVDALADLISLSGARTGFKTYGRTRVGVPPVCFPMVQLFADP